MKTLCCEEREERETKPLSSNSLCCFESIKSTSTSAQSIKRTSPYQPAASAVLRASQDQGFLEAVFKPLKIHFLTLEACKLMFLTSNLDTEVYAHIFTNELQLDTRDRTHA